VDAGERSLHPSSICPSPVKWIAQLRHMAINAMQNDTTKGSLRGKFKRAGWDDAYLSRILALF
jgi:hypothetical protein